MLGSHDIPLSRREQILFYVTLLLTLGVAVFGVFHYTSQYAFALSNPATQTTSELRAPLVPYIYFAVDCLSSNCPTRSTVSSIADGVGNLTQTTTVLSGLQSAPVGQVSMSNLGWLQLNRSSAFYEAKIDPEFRSNVLTAGSDLLIKLQFTGPDFNSGNYTVGVIVYFCYEPLSASQVFGTPATRCTLFQNYIGHGVKFEVLITQNVFLPIAAGAPPQNILEVTQFLNPLDESAVPQNGIVVRAMAGSHYVTTVKQYYQYTLSDLVFNIVNLLTSLSAFIAYFFPVRRGVPGPPILCLAQVFQRFLCPK
jgi:hypothetical protein